MSINTPTLLADVADATERAPLPEKLRVRAAELEAFYRQLPALLRDNAAGKYVVVRGDETFGVWDTFRDAVQFGYDKFGDGRFLAQKIDPRLGPALSPYFEGTVRLD